MGSVMTRHEFLTRLHALIRPKTYLEIGVQYGNSLALASAADVAIGIDPDPLVGAAGNQVIHKMTSDEFFASQAADALPTIDLAFIDGMHLVECALRDFTNVLAHSHDRTVIAFDDVLPRTLAEASRIQCPGDWAGDVWKIPFLLHVWHGRKVLVDVAPTGVLVAYGLYEPLPQEGLGGIVGDWVVLGDEALPSSEILTRRYALDPDEALSTLESWLAEEETL